MPAIHRIFEIILLLFIVAGAVYSVLALVCVFTAGHAKKEKGEKADPPQTPPGISILKPLMGADEGLRENLESFCRQAYRGNYEVLLGLSSGEDPAYPAAEEITRMFPDIARIVISDADLGANRKVSNLLGLEARARYDLIAVSDSDMRVGDDYLETIAGEYTRGEIGPRGARKALMKCTRKTGPRAPLNLIGKPACKIGLVTSLYRISVPLSGGAAFESLTIALDFIPAVLVARRLEGGLSFGLGASMLFSREAFARTGGFKAIADYLADDYQVGRRLWRDGHGVLLSKYVMEDMAGRMTVREHLLHQLRWARTYRASRPKGYLGYGVTHLFAWSLIFLLFSPGALSVSVLACALALRTLAGLAVHRRFFAFDREGRGERSYCWPKWLILLPVKDITGFGIWIASFAGRRISWRGRTFSVTREGKLR